MACRLATRCRYRPTQAGDTMRALPFCLGIHRMGYRTLADCIAGLAASGQLVDIQTEVDPYLEAAAIHRRVCAAGGPALLFSRVKGCSFRMASNLFGRIERARFLFRDTLARVEQMVALRADPEKLLRRPWRHLGLVRSAWHMRPRYVRRGAVLTHRTTIDRLPQLQSWPRDGGPFITLPLVYSEDPNRPGPARSNLGMYRVQLGGGAYEMGREVGLHYQIQRGIGVHHAAAIRRGEPLAVNVFVGGAPAMTLAAVMPLPEGMSELGFAGALAGHRIPLVRISSGLPVYAQADFCITGKIDPARRLPEGPFGDHLGYYSLAHDYPVMRVEEVYHRTGAIWPFTVVGRPPQEDSAFGQLIHELTGPALPAVLPGLKCLHAVDAAGVHPLLLAIGSERYTPYGPRERPQELLTLANAILGQGQLSLAKYLWIAAQEDDPALDVHQIGLFLAHVLARFDPVRDLHFQTQTTIDTLDYSGEGLNAGSKLVIAAVGAPQRILPTTLAACTLPAGFADPRICLPGVLAIRGPKFERAPDGDPAIARLCEGLPPGHPLRQFPLLVVCDDSPFVADSLANFLWVTFTRSNPASDVHGVEAFVREKHWGCRGPLVIDARAKPHHAPPLEEDPAVTRRVEALAGPGGPLHGII